MEVVVSRGGRFITPRLGVDFSHEVSPGRRYAWWPTLGIVTAECGELGARVRDVWIWG